MAGRTPEYLGKKIEMQEMQCVIAAIFIPAFLILMGTAISSVLPEALTQLKNHGPHGFSEMLYAFTSCAGNNGSSFAGLDANTSYYNFFLGSVMWTARMTIVLASLKIGSLLASKGITPPSAGTFSTSSFLFFVLLVSVLLIQGILVFFPALSLGPYAEHLLMLEGKSF
jgi:K+-transporting ATPase ATPase A chain